MPEPAVQRPVMFFHCRGCLSNGRRDKIAAGFGADGHMVVWCEACDRLVARLPLKRPADMSSVRCEHPEHADEN